MNCYLCIALLREKNKCPGCRSFDKQEPVSIARCKIKNCELIKKNILKYCSSKCNKFPCQRLKNLDERYRTKYSMSMIDNLNMIEQEGIRKFIESEEKRWVEGDRIFCVHNKKFYDVY
jgi:hypothetical protein